MARVSNATPRFARDMKPAQADAERTLSRIDSYPYRHRVRAVMRSPAKFADGKTPVAAAMARLMNERISSLYVCLPSSDQNHPPASETGIITERDILRALAAHGEAALQMPVEQLMSK